MVSNHVVKFLVNREQFERLRNNASARGFNTISAYLREISLKDSLMIETMILEMHREVCKNGRSKY